MLFQVYASTRTAELAQVQWSEAQKQAFLHQQFNVRQLQYRAMFPQAQTQIIVQAETPVGSLSVARLENEFRLIDLALLPAFRGRGLGTRLLRELMTEAQAAGRPLRLQVERTNPARRLYARMGFQQTGEGEVYLPLEWSPHRKKEGPVVTEMEGRRNLDSSLD